MSKLRIHKPMEVYATMEHWVRILAVALAFLAALCGYWAYQLGKRKAETARLEARWSDVHKGVAAVRLAFSEGSNDLGFLSAMLHIEIVKGPKTIGSNDLGIVAKDSEFYLPPGTYNIEIRTRQYEPEVMSINVSDEMIGQRIWLQPNLKRLLPSPFLA
jgi:hypothetical protein